MIDIENKVVNQVFNALQADSATISFYSEYVETPAKFPCVTIWEANNSVAKAFITTDKVENVAEIMFEVNIYSDKRNGKKAEAKHIADIVDTAMETMGFARTLRQQIPNLDRSIYRIVMRYSAMVTKTIVDGNNYYTVYPR